MYTFSQFLEAVMGRSAIPMDQDDVNYLNQFPKNFWPDAIKQRYNDLLLQAIARGTSDPVNVKVRTARKGQTGEGGIKQLQINARMDKVLSKLKNLGFDLSDPHPETQTLSNMKLMNREQARTLIKNWLNYSAQAGQEGLVPGYARFTPTKLERGVQSYDDPYDDESRSRWAQISKDVIETAKRLTGLFINKLSRPNDSSHINYYYWRERQDEITKELIQRIKDNLADPDIMNPKKRYYLMNGQISLFNQTGHVSRRTLARAKKEKVDIPSLIKQGHTMAQITDALNKAYVGGKHGSNSQWSFNIEGPPQQQDFLKNIHQSAETPDSAIANYGKQTISALRQRHSQKVMQNPEMQQKVTPYQLAPEAPPYRGLPTQQQYQQLARQAAQKQQKKAARDISDIISFKDWVYALG